MPKKPCGCETLTNDIEYIDPLCRLHAEPCDCAGCWDCTGKVRGCTCHIDWYKVYGHE